MNPGDLPTCTDCRLQMPAANLTRYSDTELLCCVCLHHATAQVPYSTRAHKRHHAPHGPRPGKGLPAGVPIERPRA